MNKEKLEKIVDNLIGIGKDCKPRMTKDQAIANILELEGELLSEIAEQREAEMEVKDKEIAELKRLIDTRPIGSDWDKMCAERDRYKSALEKIVKLDSYNDIPDIVTEIDQHALDQIEECPKCQGFGVVNMEDDLSIKCKKCDGIGKIQKGWGNEE